MKRLTDYLKSHKKLLVISGLLVLLIALAFMLYGSKNKFTGASSSASHSETEVKLMRVLSEINGVGKSEVMINEGKNGIEGVIIVCDGANNIMTRSDILNAVSTALNLDKNNIAIYAMNK